MDTILLEVIQYLTQNYKGDGIGLSVSKLSKLVFLADWKSAINNRKQITNIQWTLHYSGPFCDEVSSENITKTSGLRIYVKQTLEHVEVDTVILTKPPVYSDLNEKYKLILNIVLKNTQYLRWPEFLDFVYGTFPFEVSEPFTPIDLVELAEFYRDYVASQRRARSTVRQYQRV